ncbi:unnamed protein product [Amoebophrya sp. A120]|nr:unnamed protein product [Amoebophrya sp. A120]|eukprot:GSA120T00019657001.1
MDAPPGQELPDTLVPPAPPAPPSSPGGYRGLLGVGATLLKRLKFLAKVKALLLSNKEMIANKAGSLAALPFLQPHQGRQLLGDRSSRTSTCESTSSSCSGSSSLGAAARQSLPRPQTPCDRLLPDSEAARETKLPTCCTASTCPLCGAAWYYNSSADKDLAGGKSSCSMLSTTSTPAAEQPNPDVPPWVWEHIHSDFFLRCPPRESDEERGDSFASNSHSLILPRKRSNPNLGSGGSESTTTSRDTTTSISPPYARVNPNPPRTATDPDQDEDFDKHVARKLIDFLNHELALDAVSQQMNDLAYETKKQRNLMTWLHEQIDNVWEERGLVFQNLRENFMHSGTVDPDSETALTVRTDLALSRDKVKRIQAGLDPSYIQNAIRKFLFREKFLKRRGSSSSFRNRHRMVDVSTGGGRGSSSRAASLDLAKFNSNSFANQVSNRNDGGLQLLTTSRLFKQNRDKVQERLIRDQPRPVPVVLKKGVYQCGHDYGYMSNEQVYELMSYKYEGAVHSELRSAPKNTHHQWLSPVVHETDVLPYQLFGNKARKWMLLRKDWTLEDIQMPDADEVVDERIIAADVGEREEDALFAGETREEEETVHHETGAKVDQNPADPRAGRTNRHKAAYHFTYPIAFRNEEERQTAVMHNRRTTSIRQSRVTSTPTSSSPSAAVSTRDDSSRGGSATSGTSSTTNSSSTSNLREDDYSTTPVGDHAEEQPAAMFESLMEVHVDAGGIFAERLENMLDLRERFFDRMVRTNNADHWTPFFRTWRMSFPFEHRLSSFSKKPVVDFDSVEDFARENGLLVYSEGPREGRRSSSQQDHRNKNHAGQNQKQQRATPGGTRKFSPEQEQHQLLSDSQKAFLEDKIDTTTRGQHHAGSLDDKDVIRNGRNMEYLVAESKTVFTIITCQVQNEPARLQNLERANFFRLGGQFFERERDAAVENNYWGCGYNVCTRMKNDVNDGSVKTLNPNNGVTKRKLGLGLNGGMMEQVEVDI